MTIPRLPDRDGAQVDALVADRYLDALLAAAERRSGDVPGDPSLDPALREAARVLQESLVRIHPSFRFGERLAARLADLAAAQARPELAAAGGVVIPFRGRSGARQTLGDDPLVADPLLAAIIAGDLDPADAAAVERATPGAIDRRPLLVGGAAITSAALSIVGVALVAWRASRPGTRGPSATAMVRAARTAHARRAAALAGLSGGPA